MSAYLLLPNLQHHFCSVWLAWSELCYTFAWIIESPLLFLPLLPMDHLHWTMPFSISETSSRPWNYQRQRGGGWVVSAFPSPIGCTISVTAHTYILVYGKCFSSRPWSVGELAGITPAATFEVLFYFSLFVTLVRWECATAWMMAMLPFLTDKSVDTRVLIASLLMFIEGNTLYLPLNDHLSR